MEEKNPNTHNLRNNIKRTLKASENPNSSDFLDRNQDEISNLNEIINTEIEQETTFQHAEIDDIRSNVSSDNSLRHCPSLTDNIGPLTSLRNDMKQLRHDIRFELKHNFEKYINTIHFKFENHFKTQQISINKLKNDFKGEIKYLNREIHNQHLKHKHDIDVLKEQIRALQEKLDSMTNTHLNHGEDCANTYRSNEINNKEIVVTYQEPISTRLPRFDGKTQNPKAFLSKLKHHKA